MTTLLSDFERSVVIFDDIYNADVSSEDGQIEIKKRSAENEELIKNHSYDCDDIAALFNGGLRCWE